jgi:hypothetical protein
MKNTPVHRALLLGDAINELTELAGSFANLEHTAGFQSFTTWEKAEYQDALGRIRDLITELIEDAAQEHLAS